MTYSTTGPKHLLGVISLAVALAGLAGCSMGTMQLSGPAAAGSVQVALRGNVHGGEQPVSGATVQLYAVGSGSYGAAATPLISASVQTDSGGNFSITGAYTCPTSGNPMVYLLATGGNPGLASGTDNTAIALAAPIGPCSSLSATTFIQANEVTTVATAYALGQYFAVTGSAGSTVDSIGAPTTAQAQTGITNAFATAATLANITSGTANESVALTGAGGSVSAVPEYLKLQTIADILASCVNTTSGSSSNCSTLFTDSMPTAGTAPTDIFQAAVDMSLNPTSGNSASNVTTMYGLISANPPFPALGSTSAPTDWTLGIQYQDATGAALNDPQNIAADGNGNIWVLSEDGSNDNLVELSASAPGTPLFEGNTFNSISIAALSPRNLAIDTNNNVWFTTTTSSSYVFEYTPGGSAVDYATGKSAYGLAINGNNDVFVGQESSSAPYELYEFPNANIARPVAYPLDGGGTNNVLTPEYMAFDTAGNLWMTNGSNKSPTTANDVVELSGIASDSNINTTCGGTYAPCVLTSATYTAVSGSGISEPWGVAATSGGSVWVGNSGGNGVYEVSGTTASQFASGVSGAHYDAVDGNGNVWVTAKTSAIIELDRTGTLVSPAAGYPHAGYISGALGITIDPSGNVWVASNSSSTPTSVYEMVGAAAPTVTPIAASLANNSVSVKP